MLISLSFKNSMLNPIINVNTKKTYETLFIFICIKNCPAPGFLYYTHTVVLHYFPETCMTVYAAIKPVYIVFY